MVVADCNSYHLVYPVDLTATVMVVADCNSYHLVYPVDLTATVMVVAYKSLAVVTAKRLYKEKLLIR